MFSIIMFAFSRLFVCWEKGGVSQVSVTFKSIEDIIAYCVKPFLLVCLPIEYFIRRLFICLPNAFISLFKAVVYQ